jgi:chromosomal replication initiation ATPase DnaA
MMIDPAPLGVDLSGDVQAQCRERRREGWARMHAAAKAFDPSAKEATRRAARATQEAAMRWDTERQSLRRHISMLKQEIEDANQAALARKAQTKTDRVLAEQTRVEMLRLEDGGILDAVGAHYGVAIVDILGKRQGRAFVEPRHVAMFLQGAVLGWQQMHIATRFRVTHSAVSYAAIHVALRIEEDPAFAAELDAIRARMMPQGGLE